MNIFELQPGVPAPWIQAYMWERSLYPFCVNVGLFRANNLTVKPDGIPVLLWALLTDCLSDDKCVLYSSASEKDFTAIVPSRFLTLVTDPLVYGTFVKWKTPKRDTIRGFFEAYIPPGVKASVYLPDEIAARCLRYKVNSVRFQPESVSKHMRGLIVQRSPAGNIFYAVDVRKLSVAPEV